MNDLITKKLMILATGLIISVVTLFNLDLEALQQTFILIGQPLMVCAYIIAEKEYYPQEETSFKEKAKHPQFKRQQPMRQINEESRLNYCGYCGQAIK